MHRVLGFVAATFLAVLPLALARADAPDASSGPAGVVRAVVDRTILPLMSAQGIPGMAVAVTLGARSYVFNYGVASKEAGTPVGDATLFEIGSVSKTLTATLAAYAAATGRLSFADHPGRYVSALRGHPVDRATLMQLGTYTAGGLPLQFPDEVAASDEGAIAYLRAWHPKAEPGAVREYSNVSLGLLGHVTAVAMKSGFADAMQTQLLPKLGMKHSHIHVPASAMQDYAWGYREGRPVRVNPGPFDEETYGIKTTAADMIGFVQANIDPARLEPPVREAIEATQVGHYRVGGMVQGLGWEQYRWPLSREALLQGNSEQVIQHANPVTAVSAPSPDAARLFDKTGSTGGFGSYVAFVPREQLGIVMLANRNYPIAARVDAAYAILNELAASQRR